MALWWVHQADRVPNFHDAAEMERVEDLTGSMPLLLRPLLEYAGKDFHEIESDFCCHKDLAVVHSNIQAFANEKCRTETPQNYISLVRFCRPPLVLLMRLPKILPRSAF